MSTFGKKYKATEEQKSQYDVLMKNNFGRVHNFNMSVVKYMDAFADVSLKIEEKGFEVGSSSFGKSIDVATQIIDLLLEPEEAEETIGDIQEGYLRRAEKNKGHAVRWLWMQTGWITVNRCFDLMRKFASAKAGK